MWRVSSVSSVVAHSWCKRLRRLLVPVVQAGQVVLLPHFHGAGRAAEAGNPDGLGIEHVAEQAQGTAGSFVAGGYRLRRGGAAAFRWPTR